MFVKVLTTEYDMAATTQQKNSRKSSTCDLRHRTLKSKPYFYAETGLSIDHCFTSQGNSGNATTQEWVSVGRDVH